MPYIQLQFRRDTSLNWQNINPLLASGEMGIELDTHTFKIGDGTQRWNNLPYGGLQGPPGPAGGAPVSPGLPGQILTFIGPNINDVAWADAVTGPGNCAIIKASRTDTNFNFLNANTNISSTFGGNYTPGIYINNVLTGPATDTTGFAITLVPRYNMAYLPIIMGTIAYWDGTKMNYMQIKFGHSTTNNAIRATIIPGNLTLLDQNNVPRYGSPLQLRIEGISSSALNGVENISTVAPINYAILIYLKMMN